MAVPQIQYSGFGVSGYDAINASKMQQEISSTGLFKSMLDSSVQGDYRSSFAAKGVVSPADTHSRPSGLAANTAPKDIEHSQKVTVDRTSKLYEKAQELESYLVKIMLSSMRSTLNKSSLYGDSYASKMYEDMMYDELSVSMTKNAGFGLADQVYLELSRNA